jgi:hypothetical protein
MAAPAIEYRTASRFAKGWIPKVIVGELMTKPTKKEPTTEKKYLVFSD